MELRYHKIETTTAGSVPAAVEITAADSDAVYNVHQRIPGRQVFLDDNLNDWHSDVDATRSQSWQRVITAEEVVALADALDQRWHLVQCLEGYSFPAHARMVEGVPQWPGKLKYGLDLGKLQYVTWPALNLPAEGDDYIEPHIGPRWAVQSIRNTIALFCAFVADGAFCRAPEVGGGHPGVPLDRGCQQLGLTVVDSLTDEALFYCLAWACALVRKVAAGPAGREADIQEEFDPIFEDYLEKAKDYTGEEISLQHQNGNLFGLWTWPVATAQRLLEAVDDVDQFGRSNSPWCHFERQATPEEIARYKAQLYNDGMNYRGYIDGRWGPYIEPCPAHVRRQLRGEYIYTQCVDPKCARIRPERLHVPSSVLYHLD